MKEFRFLLPEDDPKLYIQLILMVPDTCQWVDGALHAAKERLESNQVVPFSAFSFCRFGERGFELSEDRATQGESRRPPNYYAHFIEEKWPEFVYFDEAGFSPGSGLTIQAAKHLAAGYVHRGYRGKLSFYLGFKADDKYANKARCHIHLEPWEELDFSSLPRRIPQPPMIIFQSLEKSSGEEASVSEPSAFLMEHRLELPARNDDLWDLFVVRFLRNP